MKEFNCAKCAKLYKSHASGLRSWFCDECYPIQPNKPIDPEWHNKFMEEHLEQPKGGFKNDGNYLEKPDLSLVPTEALFEMAKALTFGAKKYSRYNFREGMDISRPIAASLRHTYQFLDGEDIDEETQCIHLGNAMAGLAMAIWLLKNKPECDNRYKKPKE